VRLAVAVLLMAGGAQAAALKELLDSADHQNVDKRISVEQRRAAVAQAQQAWTQMLPYLSAQGIWTHNQYAASFSQPIIIADCLPDMATGICTVPSTQHNEKWIPDAMGNPSTAKLTIQPQDQLDAVFRVDLPIIDTTRWFRTAAAIANEKGAIEREDATRDNVHRQVVGAWFSYAASLAVRESAVRSLKVAEEQERLQDVREKAGAATELELLRARAEVQRNRQVISDTDVLVATTRRSLFTLTGIDPGDAAPLPAIDMRPEAPFAELEKNVEALPSVRAADRDVEATQRNGDVQRLALVPTVGAQFTERLSNATGFTGQVSNWNAGATLSWRLDAPTIVGFNIVQAQESVSRLAAEKIRLISRDQIYSDWQRLNAALSKIDAAKSQVEAAQRAAQVARDRYAAGAATQVDVIQAERDLFSAEVSMIQAQTDLGSARLSLRISAGLALEL
jgi:outer membrane protein TolC